ncbi:MAG: hypothetical protein WCW13_00720 [archaeon]|jgi:hypothetical protein
MVLGLIARIIQIVQGFFKKDTLILKTRIEDVPLLIEKNFGLKSAELDEFSAKKIAQIKYLHSKSVGLLEDISKKDLQEKPNERFNKAANTSKSQLENQLKRLLEKLNPKDRGKTVVDSRAYSGESYALLINEINGFRKNIVYTSIYLKDEMKELGETLQEMLNTFAELNQFFSKSNDFFEFEKVKTSVGEIIKKKKEVENIENKQKEFLESLAQKENKIQEQKDKILQKKVGKEMIEVKKLEEEMTHLMSEKQDLKTEISGLLINIDRPMQRFKQLVDSGRWKIPLEEKEMLEQFMVNPILALKKDPKAEIFKKVLLEICKAIEENEVELKDKEREKRLNSLQELINFDFFGKVFWKMNELQKKQNDLNKELESSPAKKEVEKEETKLKELESELANLKAKSDENQNYSLAVKKELAKSVNQVKDFAQESLKKTLIFEEEAY